MVPRNVSVAVTVAVDEEGRGPRHVGHGGVVAGGSCIAVTEIVTVMGFV